MPSVPYIRFYTDFPRHRKTTVLRRLLGAYEYIVNLWCWAAENAPDGDLSSFTVEEIEIEARWAGERGKALAAFVESGFIDRDGESLKLHNWMDRTGQGVEQLVKYREKKKIKQREKREREEQERLAGIIPGDVPESVPGNKNGNVGENPFTLTLSSSLSSNSGSEIAPFVPKKTIPNTAANLIHCMRVAINREQSDRGLWNDGGTFAAAEARGFLEGFGASPPHEEIQRRIEIFASDKTMDPWTVKKFVSEYNRIGLEKRQRKAPGTIPTDWKAGLR